MNKEEKLRAKIYLFEDLQRAEFWRSRTVCFEGWKKGIKSVLEKIDANSTYENIKEEKKPKAKNEIYFSE